MVTKLRVLSILTLASFVSQGYAGMNYRSSVTINGGERFLAFNIDGMMGSTGPDPRIARLLKGDFSELKPAAAPARKFIPLGDMINQDFDVRLDFGSKVILAEDSVGPLFLSIYSDQDADRALNGLRYEASQSTLVIKSASGNSLCAMKLASGDVSAILGTCALITIPVPPGGRVRVFIDGKVAMRSAAVRTAFADVISESSSSNRVRVLQTYVDGGGRITPSQLLTLVGEVQMGSDKVSVVRISASHLTVALSGDLVVKVIDEIVMSSDKLNVLREVSQPGRANLAGSELVHIVEGIVMDSDKIETLRVVLPVAGSISAIQAGSIIKSLTMSSRKLDALRLLITKVPGDQIEGLAEQIEDEFMLSDGREAQRLLLRSKR